MKRLLLLLILIAAIAASGLAVVEDYSNPVIKTSLPDPTIIKAADGYFYLYATEDIHNVPVFRSRNLTSWRQMGTAFTDATRPTFVDGAAIWAPDINYINGQYVLYYSMSVWGGTSTCGIGVATASKPTGPFSNAQKLFISSEIGVTNSIDPFYIEDDGKKYLFWGSFNGIYGIQLSDDGLSVAQGASKKQIANKTIEGTYIHKHDGYYYLIGSEGSCCEGENSTYKLVVARSESLMGTYKNKKGEDVTNSSWFGLSNNNLSEMLVGDDFTVGPGHCSEIVQDEAGQDWIMHHGFQRTDIDAGRVTYLERVLWDSDGWPYVEGGVTAQSAPRPIFAADGKTLAATLTKVNGVYQLKDAKDVETFSTLVNDYGFVDYNAALAADIDFTDYVHIPIGTDAHRYRGVFDGQGYRIKNMTLQGGTKEQGLFSVLQGGAVIRNVIIDGSCNINAGPCTTALVGCCNGTDNGSEIVIENCGNEADVHGTGANNAAILGCNYDAVLKVVILNCYNTGNISGGWENGLLSGWMGNNDSQIFNSWSTGSISEADGDNSIARGIKAENLVSTYDLNTDNARLAVNTFADYKQQWLQDGHWGYLMNGDQSVKTWVQTLGKDVHPYPCGKHDELALLRGDANNDGRVSVKDVVEVVSKIQGRQSAQFDRILADADFSGEISLADIKEIVEIICTEK